MTDRRSRSDASVPQPTRPRVNPSAQRPNLSRRGQPPPWGRAGAAGDVNRTDNHGHWRITKPEVGHATCSNSTVEARFNDEATPKLPRRIRGLPTRGGHPRNEPRLIVTVEPTARPGVGIILDGRATSVPFTAVLNGPERTTTDNTNAASTCAVPHPHKSQQRPIWLWEQGVARSDLGSTFMIL
jgi:hypothetical protein